MVSNWEPGTQYDYGAIVEYEGESVPVALMPPRQVTLYIQITRTRSSNHISLRYTSCAVYSCIHLLNGLVCTQWDSTPDRTPALWGRVHRGHGSDREPEENDSSKEWHEHKTQQVEIQPEDRQKKWYDLDDKKKKELEVRTVDFKITLDHLNNYGDRSEAACWLVPCS